MKFRNMKNLKKLNILRKSKDGQIHRHLFPLVIVGRRVGRRIVHTQ